MRAYTLTELMNLTRAELFALHRQIVDAIALLPEAPRGSRHAADIRRVLARCQFAPS